MKKKIQKLCEILIACIFVICSLIAIHHHQNESFVLERDSITVLIFSVGSYPFFSMIFDKLDAKRKKNN
ncbi:hypothetical protein R9X47_27110 [Wukongibacter baidiensis]|uniref:hypothetical protein n=1 Tax=Wukongibacter baidiensis TaxID=1723361 RepID=UPI003D7F49EB